MTQFKVTLTFHTLNRKENIMKAKDVALWFLNENEVNTTMDEADYLTTAKLQHLLYFAQGASLAKNDRALFDENIIAQGGGPIVKSVYKTYSSYGVEGIRKFKKFDYSKATQEETDLLSEVFEIWGIYTSSHLCNLIQYEEPPYYNTLFDEVINTDVMKKHFDEVHIEHNEKGGKNGYTNNRSPWSVASSVYSIFLQKIIKTIKRN